MWRKHNILHLRKNIENSRNEHNNTLMILNGREDFLFLGTVLIKIKCNNGKFKEARAILDNGSQVSIWLQMTSLVNLVSSHVCLIIL